MAFDPSSYKPTGLKKKPVVLLLDVSGSMSGEKITSLHDAVVEMINSFVALKVKEFIVEVAIITFGATVELHTRYTPVETLQKTGVQALHADGGTPLGLALKMAKDMLEDVNESPKGNYAPAVVLVSDGEPTDDWRAPLRVFIDTGRTRKCQRFAVAIGVNANRTKLREFAESDDAMFYAEDAEDIAEILERISTSTVTTTRETNKARQLAGAQKEQAPGGMPSSFTEPDDEDEWM